MAKKKKLCIPDKIYVSVSGEVAIVCPDCNGNKDDCERCHKGFVYEKLYTGKIKNPEKFIHYIYKLEK